MEPTWVLSAPDWPHVGPMNLAIRGRNIRLTLVTVLAWCSVTKQLLAYLSCWHIDHDISYYTPVTRYLLCKCRQTPEYIIARGKCWVLRRGKLTYWGQMTHICVNILGHNWFRLWLVACSAPSHYMYPNQCWFFVTGFVGTNLREISIEIQTVSLKKMQLNIESAKWGPFDTVRCVTWS